MKRKNLLLALLFAIMISLTPFRNAFAAED